MDCSFVAFAIAGNDLQGSRNIIRQKKSIGLRENWDRVAVKSNFTIGGRQGAGKLDQGAALPRRFQLQLSAGDGGNQPNEPVRIRGVGLKETQHGILDIVPFLKVALC